jgi:hypothetical protein
VLVFRSCAARRVTISPRPKRPATTPTHWAAGALGYVALVALLAKLARALELSLRSSSGRPWLLLPALIGQDLVLIAAVGLLGHAFGRMRSPWLRRGLTLLLLVPIGLLLPADVLAHMLTGRPITFQRLRGDEGATLKNLNLLAKADLIGGTLGIACALLLLWPVLAYGARLLWLRRWARPRTLLATMLVGFGASIAQAAFLPRTQGLAEQPVFVLLGSLVDTQRLKALALSEQQWRALHRPDIPLPPPPTAPRVRGLRPKNVVIFLGEGIPFKATGFDRRFAKARRGWSNPTPNLTRRYNRHGLLFDRYYANWHASIQAIFSIVCSAFPPPSGDIVRVKPRIDCGELSEVMAAHGIEPGLFHSGQFNFYNKLALLGRRGYAVELDAEELEKTSKRSTHEWGIDDRAMVDATLAWVDSLPHGKSFSALMIAVSPHYPYWVPPDFARPFKGGSQQDRFLNGVTFLDTVFEQLLRGFEQRGLYDDTLFVWLGDHGHYVGEPERATPGLREFYEPNLHVALVLLNSRMFPPSMPKKERINSRLSSHVDLLPTILDALDLPQDHRHEGQSLLGDHFEQRRVFFGADDAKYIGFIEGQNKFVVDTQTQRTEYYDLASDPEELKDSSHRFPERMSRYSEEAISFARGAQARIDSAPVLEEKVSIANVYELFTQHVSVQLEPKDNKTQACTAGPNPVCPGLGRVLRVQTAVMQGEKRRCIMVKVPQTGRIELSVRDRDTLDLLTGTIVAMPGQPKGNPRFRIDTFTDGKQQQSAYLSLQLPVRPRHPKARQQIRFRFERLGESTMKAAEVCLQLTTLFSK